MSAWYRTSLSLWDISSITRVFAPSSVKILNDRSVVELLQGEYILFPLRIVFDVLSNIVRRDGEDEWILRTLQ